MKFDISSLKWYQKIRWYFTNDGWQLIGYNLCKKLMQYPIEVRDRVYHDCFNEYGVYLQIIMEQEHKEHLCLTKTQESIS